ncbi:MAG: DUF1328 domain-containing protein [Candidatus Thiothrix singaporensis]|uniref:UPF0391 membrane protein HZT40_08855 n=1 Tax=Candidatus Thiothrix singaporensis TaxID=2799669 RepID=A0A7L6ARE4_9GAMM|nr:MAG: DUF1328 domain-containing protein [Candidatus Thiothrix singaporensis]
MINWSITFLIIALIAAVLGFSGIAGTAVNIAWILFVVGLVLSLVFYVTVDGLLEGLTKNMKTYFWIKLKR